jgi:hypothetical protein
MAQTDVEHMRAESEPLGAAGEIPEVGERVEDRRVGGYRWMLLTGCGDRDIVRVNTRCSGNHTDS